MNLQDLLQVLVFVLVFKWAATGAYVWLRYGYDGTRFLWSKQFPGALLDWQIRCGEENDLRPMIRPLRAGDRRP